MIRSHLKGRWCPVQHHDALLAVVYFPEAETVLYEPWAAVSLRSSCTAFPVPPPLQRHSQDAFEQEAWTVVGLAVNTAARILAGQSGIRLSAVADVRGYSRGVPA